MKWIFYTLLLANLAYLAFNLIAKATPAVTDDSNPTMVNISPSWEAPFEERGARILFLSEAVEQENKSTLKLLPEQPTLVAPASDLKACMGLGPFENVLSAQDVAGRLNAMSYTAKMTAVDTPTGEFDYRVMLPPVSSTQEAFRKLREFKSRDIDSFVITKGVNARGISLGVFSSNGTAEDHRRALVAQGYDVHVNAIPRVNRSYWIQINQGMFPEGLLSDVATEFNQVEVTETGCMN